MRYLALVVAAWEIIDSSMVYLVHIEYRDHAGDWFDSVKYPGAGG